MKFEWKCPKCGATPNKHGKSGRDTCIDRRSDDCLGFICECDEDSGKEHGTTLADPCRSANCYHCGWGGTFPKAPKGLLAWEKTALANGWKPPAKRAAELKTKTGGALCRLESSQDIARMADAIEGGEHTTPTGGDGAL